jgi:hypothetical protein
MPTSMFFKPLTNPVEFGRRTGPVLKFNYLEIISTKTFSKAYVYATLKRFYSHWRRN